MVCLSLNFTSESSVRAATPKVFFFFGSKLIVHPKFILTTLSLEQCESGALTGKAIKSLDKNHSNYKNNLKWEPMKCL